MLHWPVVGRSRDAAKHFRMHRTPPQTDNHPTQSLSNAKDGILAGGWGGIQKSKSTDGV